MASAITENNRRDANVGVTTVQTTNTASITPVAQKLLVMMVGAYVSDARTIVTPKLSDAGGRTWDLKAASSLSSDSKRKLFVYTCVSNNNPSAGIITIDSGAGATTDNMGWGISELNFARIDNNLAAIKQVGSTVTSGAATTAVGSLPNLDSSNSFSMSIFWMGTNQTPTYTGGTIAMVFGGGSIVGAFGYAYKSNDSAPTISFTSDSVIFLPFEVMAPLTNYSENKGSYIRVGDGSSRSEVAN